MRPILGPAAARDGAAGDQLVLGSIPAMAAGCASQARRKAAMARSASNVRTRSKSSVQDGGDRLAGDRRARHGAML